MPPTNPDAFILDGSPINLVSAGGNIVSINPADGGLIINGPSVNPGADVNLFIVEVLDNIGVRALTDRCRIALRSQFNHKYVCAEKGGGHQLVANRDAAALWETFEVHILGIEPPAQPTGVMPGASIALRACSGQFVAPEAAPSKAVSARQWRAAGFALFPR